MPFRNTVIVAAAALAAVSAPARAVEADFAVTAEAIVKAAYPATGPGGAAIVTEGGRIVYVGASGMADIAGGKPITADTVFRMGSLTKQFAAAVVLQLVAEGKLSLDDPLVKFVPGYPADKGGTATVRQLLNHTSGIQSYTGIPGWMAGDKPARRFTTAEMIDEFKDRPTEFKPGEKYNYNNSGYVLVGAVIERVTGKPWWQAVDERIVKPLGLESIRYGLDEAQVPAFAVGYTLGEGGAVPARAFDMSVPHAAGALIGTVGDFAKWSHALHHGKVVRSDLYAEMIAPTKLADGTMHPYGYGLAQSTLRGLPVLTHSGGIFGFATNALYIPERDVTVVVFTNADAGIQPAGIPMTRLAAAAIGKPHPVFTAVEPDLDALAPMLGVYAIDGGDRTRLFHMRDGKLYTRRTDAGDSPVFSAGGGRFFYGPDSLNWFEIVPADGGGYAMLMHQNGEEQAERAVRTGGVPELAEVAVPRETLITYTGSYRSPVAPIAVTLEKGVLSLAFGPQPPAPLRAVSDSEFVIDAVGLKVAFTRTDGKVGGLVLTMAGRSLPAEKVSPIVARPIKGD